VRLRGATVGGAYEKLRRAGGESTGAPVRVWVAGGQLDGGELCGRGGRKVRVRTETNHAEPL
jgi:hypothetical protein